MLACLGNNGLMDGFSQHCVTAPQSTSAMRAPTTCIEFVYKIQEANQYQQEQASLQEVHSDAMQSGEPTAPTAKRMGQHLQVSLLQLARYDELLQLLGVARLRRCTVRRRAALVGPFALTEDQLTVPELRPDAARAPRGVGLGEGSRFEFGVRLELKLGLKSGSGIAQ